MDSSTSKPAAYPVHFIRLGLILLAFGMLFGIIGGLQYVLPGFLKEILSFERTRPLHVSSVLFWIILTATGGIFTYVQEHSGRKIHSALLLRIQFFLFGISTVLIMACYLAGMFGGREYWEYPPYLSIFIVAGWILFLINFLRTTGSFKKQPVYIWMWLTGIIFFLFTFVESYLWVLPYFRKNIVNDMTIQWKSYGSMVGSWNQLIYGSSTYLMCKISGDRSMAFGKKAFALYFIGLFNLMFNWGHHIYTLPTHAYVRQISYAVSMTELLLLGRIIWEWKQSLGSAQKFLHLSSYRLMLAADVWIFLNLLLAIGMSVPAINVYTHGTHVTVAHAMGTTIGINTMLLLAIVTDILFPKQPGSRNGNTGFWLANISLLIFWLSLIIAGIWKARWQMSINPLPFSSMMQQLRPFFMVFLISGTTLAAGIGMILFSLFKKNRHVASNQDIQI
ncbi:MAG TPA: cbb3-type cytochrome c oxidase subunit I [Sediminibacterium sp.]|nr:cbb3-type cytochrome c oxidase subunit I [Sediminibacterium sp.]